jgi:ATP:cob(I)alamin adenosyltransferase
MSITTKTGDDGYTSLLNGKRVHKFDLRIELMGNMDELLSHLGLIKSEIKDSKFIEELEAIQENISKIMAQVAYGSSEKYNLNKEELNSIETLIADYESMYIPESKFIVPGKNRVSALMDVCRTIGRRIERNLISVHRFYPVDEVSRIYLNRVSDYLYAGARYIDFKEEITHKVKEYLNKEEIVPMSNTSSNNVSMNLKLAKRLLEAIEKKALEIGLPVVLAIANEWGNIIAVHFMDGALPGSYNIAVDKAYTSAALRMSTEELGKLSQDGQPLYGINNTNNNRIIVFGGGVPLKLNGTLIGGLGISGGTAEQDSELANYGAAVLRELG